MCNLLDSANIRSHSNLYCCTTHRRLSIETTSLVAPPAKPTCQRKLTRKKVTPLLHQILQPQPRESCAHEQPLTGLGNSCCPQIWLCPGIQPVPRNWLPRVAQGKNTAPSHGTSSAWKLSWNVDFGGSRLSHLLVHIPMYHGMRTKSHQNNASLK
ncbi:hypothetical protein BDP81DRAFT_28884 [Colletotrichum phormii]|uniref:Uncharacterized protein n=1 Tax=Colletotrichum phormii TaxID=359342 RepID=A0AAI9ZRK8_9PEZI|nr:uncharacterized protein BDP81DRAFT_28884 [Colletotrichum phormii]KAK1636808.1 hypothetical protein BDP81DRAFT_28884 [Colletotrichum phormii]